MKQIILLALAAMMMVGCNQQGIQQELAESVSENDFGICVYDSCEYVIRGEYYRGFFAHKGNCKFCKERRQQELKELVEQLKGK